MLHVLHKSTPPLRKLILKHADIDLVTTLAECSLNVLSSNQPISAKCKSALCKYKTTMRKLSQPHSRVAWKRKRRLLSSGQHGGFVGLLLGTVLSGLLSNLLRS